MENGKVIVITGPTATGKTALAVALCEKIGGEVVSADSMQVYRGFDIGTAKVTKDEMRGIPHHMIDVAGPNEPYSVSCWVEAAEKCCRDILSRGKTPVIAGGTGLYIDSLLSGRDFAPAPGDDGLREALSEEYDRIGGEKMLEKLAEFDPDRAKKLAPADKKRIVRAIEVFRLTGKTITQHDEETRALPPRFASARYALSFHDRQRLYDRIDLRVDKMVEEGLIEEVKRLLADGADPKSTAMQAIGYKEIAAALNGECAIDEAIEEIKLSSRRYAKRQLTWLRRDEGLKWLLWDEKPEIERAVGEIVGK